MCNIILRNSLTRDLLGRIDSKTEFINETTVSYSYSYDTYGQLETVSKNSVELGQYSYDLNGNRTKNNEITTSYDLQDRTISSNNSSFTHTANGELSLVQTGPESRVFTYDVFGQLESVELSSGDKIEYINDGLDRRIGKKYNGTLLQALVYKDQLKPVAELDGSGNVVSRFVYASKAQVPDYMIKGGFHSADKV